MSPLADGVIVFGIVFVSGLLGLTLRSFLPEPHLQQDSLSVVRLCTGVIGTLAALVLGLLVASAKTSYDRATHEVTHAAAAAVLLDRTLAQYGPQTNDARNILRTAQSRLLAITQAQNSIPALLLIVLVMWLAIMFAGFGLFTSTNPTVIVTLFLCAVSLAGAVLMIEELNRPFEGLMKVSSAPMRYALAHLGQ